jgi:hypothetical protein
MTIPFLGRVTPIQIVMLRFAGWEFDGRRKPQLLRSNARLLHEMGIARRALCRMTKRDFGYDLAAWHAYLKRDGSYSHPYGRSGVYSKVERVIADPQRKRLEAQLTAEEQKSGAAPTVPALRSSNERRKSIDGLQLGAYIKQSLEAQGIKTLGRLERTSDADLLALPGLGRATLRSLRAQLAERGLTGTGPARKA